MGKAEAGTPKAIGKQLKAKGLQKLKWYCQMCQKQCRDENGFQCHLSSDSHKRMMEKFGENPQGHVEAFSKQFEKDFLEHIASTHRNKPIHANQAYNEFIKNRHHVHMNSTKWTTLTEFVQDLGKRGVCKVEETQRGWFITYKPKDYQEDLRDRMQKRKQKEEEAEEQRLERAIRKQADEARRAAGDAAQPAEATELRKEDNCQSIALSLSGSKSNKRAKLARPFDSDSNPLEQADAEEPERDGRAETSSNPSLRKEQVEHHARGALDAQSMEHPRHASETDNTSASRWLHDGIVVKVMAEQLQDYYKRKGTVRAVHNDRVGELEMHGSGHLLHVDCSQLETVIPKPGSQVLIVNGSKAGKRASLSSVDTENLVAHVQLADDKESLRCEFEDVSKLAQ